MIKYLIKKFIKNSEDTTDIEVRKKYGVLGGVVGIILNAILFIVKFIFGLMINSIAVISDAFNNLSDIGSSLVSVIGANIGSKSADSEHPYGHGRAEYIASLVISFLIIAFGVELIRSSVDKIVNPQAVMPDTVAVIALLATIPVKLYMWCYNRYMGNKINSSVLLATARDSINDVIATAVTLAAAFISPYVSFPIDALAGVGVSLFIIFSGIRIAKDTVGKLIGKAPEPELIGKIEQRILKYSEISGIHDLMIHDYGPGRIIASVHAEMPSELSLIDAHNIIDRAENDIMNELNVDIVIHIDPIKS